MKKVTIFTTLIAFILLTSCNSKQQNEEKKNEVVAYEVEQLLDVAADKVEQEVNVMGHVTHTCKHSGKRCFIVGNDPNISLRVEAKGEINGFKSELIGSKINVKGILKERRLSKEYIDQYEEKVKEKQAKEDGSAETCQAEMQSIQKMRDWMKMHDKNYYAIYYVDGQSYAAIEEE